MSRRRDGLRVVRITGPASERLLRACALFGIGVCRGGAEPPGTEVGAEALLALAPCGIAAIIGPSGTGKTSLLEVLRARLHGQGLRVRSPREPVADSTVIDQFEGDLPRALATLARAGLADALLLGRRAAELSEGERFRLRLALAIHDLTPGAWLLIDEFAGTLDRVTARTLCRLMRRWAIGSRARLVIASSHDDLVAWLRPDLVVSLRHGGGGGIVRAPPWPPPAANGPRAIHAFNHLRTGSGHGPESPHPTH